MLIPVYLLSLLLIPSISVQAQTVSPQPIRQERLERMEQKLQNRITNIGKPVMVLNAKITSLSNPTLTISSENISYLITTSDRTRFLRRFWGKSDLADLQIGNTVSIHGKWSDENKTAILASQIRNQSNYKRNIVIIGQITTISDNTWIIDANSKGIQTATVNSSTKFINRAGQIITPSEILVGHRVRIRGLWDSNTNTITNITQAKDFQLPLQPKNITPTP